MLIRIQASYTVKVLSIILAIQMFSLSDQNGVYAQSGGPTQPEVHSFEPIGTNQMVDLFSGDFTYNIPLFNLPGPDGGYPINLAYHSGINMDQEASWVGLGWNINMGTINRQVRNLPDDFGESDNDQIKIKTDMRTNWTLGIGGKVKKELFGLDADFNQTAAVGGAGTLGVQVYYNNYKGIGYSVDLGINLGFSKKPAKGATALRTGDLGYNLKLDSQEGISNQYSVGFSESAGDYSSKYSASTGFNSRTGWQRNLRIEASTKQNNVAKDKIGFSVSGGSTISFSRPVTSLQVPQAMRGFNVSLAFGKGPSTIGFFKNKTFNINYSQSKLRNKDSEKSYHGVGYLYYQLSIDSDEDIESDYRIKDVMSENDGPLHKNTRRLATPTFSYDIYSVTGQGIGNMFRPFREDIGTMQPPRVKSEHYGGSVGLEMGKTKRRFGLDLSFSFSSSKSDFWPGSDAGTTGFVGFANGMMNSIYFQNYGERSSDDLAHNYGSSVSAYGPLAYGIQGEGNFFKILGKDTKGNALSIEDHRNTRKKRSQMMEPYTNSLILNGSVSAIPEFNIKYYKAPSSPSASYNKTVSSNYANYDGLRSVLTGSHIGGYIATSDQGMRYVYALPAYNKKERDVSFSVAENTGMSTSPHIGTLDQTSNAINYDKKGTNQYYNSTEKSGYAHSYFLTSVLGTDYVDLDNVAGPSDGDLGYWVKFDYALAQSAYNWRSPYSGAAYDKGNETAFTDGMGRYSFGTKEIWYVATVETKTHIAEFILSERKDNKSANEEVHSGSTNRGTGSYYKLERIDVYVKSERYKNGAFNATAKPVQSCHFVYDYSLCTGLPSNNGAGANAPSELNNQGGKLTLKKFYFTYRNNTQGASTPYEFEYNTTAGGSTIGYDQYATDRWGNYQPNTSGSNLYYPYIDPTTAKSVVDERAALWNMKAINLPSGGRYEVDYESDSYAYVQNQVAMHMFKIASLKPYNQSVSMQIDHDHTGTASQRRVYFKLEQPISSALSSTERQNAVNKYILPGEYLYFKVKINLNKSQSTKEYVSGYAKVSDVKVDETSLSGGNYLWGYVELNKLKIDDEETRHHPFTEVGARHIKYNQPDILYDNMPGASKEKLSKSDIKNYGNSLYSIFTDVKDIFTEFTKMLYNSGRLQYIDENSYIRLRTPDKVKYGGGHRVKEVRIIDNWAASFLSGEEASSTYGTVYQYDMLDENTGQTISSGVASYEPMVGSDEIPHHKPVKGWEDKDATAKTSAVTFSEDPSNESLFPGASVGYREVKVMSKVTADKLVNPGSSVVNYGGITTHEFYTAKDYPVITENTELETNKSLISKRLLVPALIVNIDRLRIAATQGYYIELNDMHGKPRGGKEIGFNGQNQPVEVSSVTYEYYDEEVTKPNDAGEQLKIRTLKNDNIPVLFSDIKTSDLTQSDIRNVTMATEVEFMPEKRYSESKSIQAGLDLNLDLAATPILLFYPIPNFSWQEEKAGTIVTNKVVNKSGILRKMSALQQGTLIETENLAFDQYTGQPLLTSVNNAFEDKVYDYSILARDVYEGTGPAYQNSGFYKQATPVSGSYADGLQRFTYTPVAGEPGFFPGDVVVARPAAGGSPAVICVFKERVEATGELVFETKQQLVGNQGFKVIRSGRRNLLSMPVSQITALSDPTKNRQIVDCKEYWHPTYLNFMTRLWIDNVISISAVELGDKWYKDTRQLKTVPSNWFDNAFYSKGMAGIYAPVRTYAYVDDRTQTLTSGQTDVKLKTDGVLNDVVMFDWTSLSTDPASGCANKWRLTSQITLKNPSSFDLETKNILGTFGSSLYGQSGTEPIATAANAKNAEIGFESFEEYAPGALNVSANASNNLNFYSNIDQTSRFTEDRFDIRSGPSPSNFIDLPLSTFTGYSNYTVRMHVDAFNNGTYQKPSELLIRLPSSPLVTSSGITRVNVPVSLINLADPYNIKWRGELFARKSIPNKPATLTNPMVIKEGVGHTGNKCMEITGGEYLQGRLTLNPGEEYQFTGWFSSPNNIFLLESYSSLFAGNFVLKFYDITGATLVETKTFTETQVLQGNFIEDWQKFSINFTMPAGAAFVSVQLPNANEVYVPSIDDYSQVAYYDDLRFQPLDGGMETYVYNQETQRLEATLDGNNYATFYYYDDEGKLFLVKRETEKGIITVQESREFIKD